MYYSVGLLLEFQVVECCPAGFLLGRDCMKQYDMVVDESTKLIRVSCVSPEFRFPIAQGVKYENRRYDPASELRRR
jgi:hypothetical protein